MTTERTKEITLTFTVETDMVPGMFYNADDFLTVVAAGLRRVPHYSPKIVSASVDGEDRTYFAELVLLQAAINGQP